MSTVFMNALQKHIAALKQKIAGSNPETIKKQIAATEALIEVTTDGRRLRRLNNDLAALKESLAEAGNVADLQRLVTSMTNLEAQLKQRPEYTRKRSSRTGSGAPGPKRGTGRRKGNAAF